MSAEQIALLRPILAEWAEGNLWVGGELMASDITFRAAPPANIAAQGLEDLGDSVLATGHQHGTGKLSGAEVEYPIFIVWTFRANEVIGVYFQGTREAALEAAGLSE